jgi:hypothetical protein
MILCPEKHIYNILWQYKLKNLELFMKKSSMDRESVTFLLSFKMGFFLFKGLGNACLILSLEGGELHAACRWHCWKFWA